MGQSSSSSSSSTPSALTRSRSATESLPRQTVDNGYLEPQSHIYASSLQEYHRPTVHKLIIARRLAPFYLGLEDYEADWDVARLVSALDEADVQATANVREALDGANNAITEAESTQMATPSSSKKSKEGQAAAVLRVAHRDRLAEVLKSREKDGGGGLHWASKTEQAKLYIGGALECPICFLNYPPPLVHTRCCDQPICTECFVQIKRTDPDATHLESEPAACPFCVEPNFGCIYVREKEPVVPHGRPRMNTVTSVTSNSSEDVVSPLKQKARRRKSFAHTEKEVVTTDQIHPDWEAKLEAVRATVARRANRRIVFRQVGDRLVPVGISSGRAADGANASMSTLNLPPGFAAQVAAALDPTSSGRDGRRAARRRNEQMSQYLESMGAGVGQDLEEIMMMEAIRLSMVDDEERQKKESEEKAKAEREAGGGAPSSAAETSQQGALSNGTGALLDVPFISSTATSTMLSEAIDAPMASLSLLDPSPSSSNAQLPLLPVLHPITFPSPTTTPPPARNSVSSIGAIVSGGLAAAVSTPSSAATFSTLPHAQHSTVNPDVVHPIVTSSSLEPLPIAASTSEVLMDNEPLSPTYLPLADEDDEQVEPREREEV